MIANWTDPLKKTLKETLSLDGTNSLLLAADTADYVTSPEVTLFVDGTTDNVINGLTVSVLGPARLRRRHSVNLSSFTDGAITCRP